MSQALREALHALDLALRTSEFDIFELDYKKGRRHASSGSRAPVVHLKVGTHRGDGISEKKVLGTGDTAVDALLSCGNRARRTAEDNHNEAARFTKLSVLIVGSDG